MSAQAKYIYIETSDREVETKPGDVFNITFYLYQVQGWEYGTVLLQMRDVPEGWTYLFQLSTQTDGSLESATNLTFHLMGEERVAGVLYVNVSDAAKPAHYYLYLQAAFDGTAGPVWKYLLIASIPAPLYLRVLPMGSIVIPEWEPIFSVYVGNWTEFRVMLFYRGPDPDRFGITLEPSRASEGWCVTVTSGLAEDGLTPVLGTNQSHEVFLKAFVPSDAGEGASSIVRIIAASVRDPSNVTAEGNATVVARVVADFEASLEGPSVITVRHSGEGPTRLNITVRVHNLVLHGISVMAALTSTTPWWSGITVQLNSTRIYLDINGTGAFTIIATVPTWAAPANWTIVADLTTEEYHADIVIHRPVGMTLVLDPYHDVVVSGPLQALDAKRGESLDISVMLRYLGNIAERFDLSLQGTPSGWRAFIQPPFVDLSVRGDANVTVTLIVPSKFEAPPGRDYHFTFEVTSTGSGERSVGEFEVHLELFYLVEWFSLNRTITDASDPVAEPGLVRPVPGTINPYAASHGWASPSLAMVNLGNSPVRVSLTLLESEAGLIVELEPRSATIPWGGEQAARIRIDATSSTPTGTYAIEIRLRCDDDPSFVDRVLMLEVKVINLDLSINFPTKITGEGVEPLGLSAVRVTVQYRLELRYTVQNLGSEAVIDVTVNVVHTTPDGNYQLIHTDHLNVARGGTIEQTFLWDAHIAGHNRLGVQIVLANQSRTDNDEAWHEVEVVDPQPDHEGSLMIATIAPAVALAFSVVVALIVALALWTQRKDGGRRRQKDRSSEPSREAEPSGLPPK